MPTFTFKQALNNNLAKLLITKLRYVVDSKVFAVVLVHCDIDSTIGPRSGHNRLNTKIRIHKI